MAEKRVPNEVDYRRRAKGLPQRSGASSTAKKVSKAAGKIDYERKIGITGAAVGKDGKKLTLADQIALAQGKPLPQAEAPAPSVTAPTVDEIPDEFKKTPVVKETVAGFDDFDDDTAEPVDMTMTPEESSTRVDDDSEELDAI